uniref:Uncharacterized protein n=1 Tax=Timema poppense TaxID=170557 RepID=A0A7R9D5P3_TIMPO|nr:unnamed protein product [Timema poppensis]
MDSYIDTTSQYRKRTEPETQSSNFSESYRVLSRATSCKVTDYRVEQLPRKLSSIESRLVKIFGKQPCRTTIGTCRRNKEAVPGLGGGEVQTISGALPVAGRSCGEQRLSKPKTSREEVERTIGVEADCRPHKRIFTIDKGNPCFKSKKQAHGTEFLYHIPFCDLQSFESGPLKSSDCHQVLITILVA